MNRILTNSTPRKKQLLKAKGVSVLTPNSKQKHETNAKIVASVKMNLKKLKESNQAWKAVVLLVNSESGWQTYCGKAAA